MEVLKDRINILRDQIVEARAGRHDQEDDHVLSVDEQIAVWKTSIEKYREKIEKLQEVENEM